MSKQTSPPPPPSGNDSLRPRRPSSVFPALLAALGAAVILAACEPPAPPGTGNPTGTGDPPTTGDPPVTVNPPTAPPTVGLTFRDDTPVRKSKMLVSTNGDAPQTYTNTLLNNGSPVTAGASYRISANPGGHTPEEISVNESTGEVTFTKALYDKMTPSDLTRPTGPPAVITIEATYQGKTKSYDFTVTDHFRPRRNHSSVAAGTDIYVIGGVTRMNSFVLGSSGAILESTPRISSNDVWRSSDGGRTWDQAAGTERFTPRGEHASGILGGEIYVIAGVAGDGGTTGRDDVWRSTDRGVSWSRVTPAGASVPFPMDYGFASAVLGNAMYVMGGMQFAPITRFDQVWKSTDRGVTWTQATNASDPKFPARSNTASVVLGSAGDAKLYVIGGVPSSGAGSGGLDDVWESSDGRSWTHLNASAAAGDKFPARSRHSAAVLGDTVYVIAGSQGGLSRGDVWKSDDKGAAWTQVVTNAEKFADRVHHSSAAQGGALYVIGGSSSGSAAGTLFNDVWKSIDGGRTWVNVHANS